MVSSTCSALSTSSGSGWSTIGRLAFAAALVVLEHGLAVTVLDAVDQRRLDLPAAIRHAE